MYGVLGRYTLFIKTAYKENVECIFFLPKETTLIVVIVLTAEICNMFVISVNENSNGSRIQSCDILYLVALYDWIINVRF
jgi:hypothetical protein